MRARRGWHRALRGHGRRYSTRVHLRLSWLGYERGVNAQRVGAPGTFGISTMELDPGYADAMALVSPHCDIESRLADVPPSARVRGPLFRPLKPALEHAGRWHEFERIVPPRKRSSFGEFPLGEYLIELALAGALTLTPERLEQGMYEISRNNAKTFASTLMGRALLRLLSKDPVRLTEQAVAARRQLANYGDWRLVRHGPRHVEMVYTDEYTWLGSAIAGAAIGAFQACEVEARLETQLVDRYNGSTIIRWD